MLVVYPSNHPSIHSWQNPLSAVCTRLPWHTMQFGLSSQHVVHVSGLKKATHTCKLHIEWTKARIRHGTPTLSWYKVCCAKPCTTMPSVLVIHNLFFWSLESYFCGWGEILNMDYMNAIPFSVVVQSTYALWSDAKSFWENCWSRRVMNTNNLYLVCIYILMCKDPVCLCFYTCALNTTVDSRDLRNSRSCCQGSQMGFELLIQKIVSKRHSFQT